jgi:ABC-type branched-subunit amino acid transport system permease subunit
MLRRINLSAAIIVLVCFFLPWEQVSCGGARDTLTGMDLTRDHTVLWLVPLAMTVAVVIGLSIFRKEPRMFAIVSMVCGAVAAFLMNRERMRVNDEAGIIAAQLTGWFWLAFILTLVEIGTAIGVLLRPRRAP